MVSFPPYCGSTQPFFTTMQTIQCQNKLFFFYQPKLMFQIDYSCVESCGDVWHDQHNHHTWHWDHDHDTIHVEPAKTRSQTQNTLPTVIIIWHFRGDCICMLSGCIPFPSVNMKINESLNSAINVHLQLK